MKVGRGRHSKKHVTELDDGSDVDLGLIKSVGKAIAILETLYESGRPLRIIEIANALQMSSSAISRLASTLANGGLVDQDETGRCQLGYGLTLFGHASLGRRELDRIALPYTSELSAQFREYVSIGRLYRWKVILLRGHTMQGLNLTSVIPVHATAPGKLLAAWQDPDFVVSMLKRHGMDSYTDKTLTSVDGFMSQLEQIRMVGFSTDDQELISGLRHVAAPIRDHTGAVIASVSAGGSIRLVAGSELDNLTQATIRCASEISRQMGFREKPIP